MSISEGFDGVKQEKILVAAKIDWDATTRFELLKSSQAETERFCGRPLRRGDKFPSSRLGVVTNKTYENRETYSNFSTTILFFGTRGCGFESRCIGLYVPMYSVMVTR